jgi:hypothetical protein
MPRPGASGATSGAATAEGWTWRLIRRLALLDSWTPATQHMCSPQAARRHLRAEWTRSGDVTEPQAASLLALDETTPWTV